MCLDKKRRAFADQANALLFLCENLMLRALISKVFLKCLRFLRWLKNVLFALARKRFIWTTSGVLFSPFHSEPNSHHSETQTPQWESLFVFLHPDAYI